MTFPWAACCGGFRRMITLYGLKTCDTCRKALKALREAGQDVDFVEVREAPPPADVLTQLLATHGEAAVNRRSKTWAGLGAADRALPPADLLARHPVVMKRPVIVAGGKVYLGWTEAVRAALMS